MGVFCLAVGYEWLRRMERRLYLTTDVRASHGKPGGAAEDWLAFWEHREGPILRALVHALGICVGCHQLPWLSCWGLSFCSVLS